MKDGFCGSREVVLPAMVVERMKEDPILSELHVTDIGYYPHAIHHAIERAQPIDQYVLIYVMDGKGHYSVETEEGKQDEFTVGANQYFILPAHRPHAYHTDNDDPWTIYWIHFAGKKARYYAKDILAPTTVKPELYSRITHRTDHFEEIFNVLHNGYSIDNLTYVSSLLSYYLCSLRYIQQYRMAVKRQPADMEDGIDVVNATIHYMNENIEKRLTLADIANYTGYSASHIADLFRQSTHQSPLAYFNQLKIQHACQLLDTTPLRVNQICYKVGFDDSYYFSRLFRKVMGVAPSRYRDRQK
ncbi:MAG: helix-turn-helix domain-containing protein [Bacteroidaceae bacterium]|nr:helix-turn-helix domain-containing protein [Bacteroidaceae bacterium]